MLFHAREGFFVKNKINRGLIETVRVRLENNPVVALLGPRQCGKTHLAKELLKSFNSQKNYFNWDLLATTRLIQKSGFRKS